METQEKISNSEAYKILEMPNCPIRLPKARSMMQARMDLEHLKGSLKKWRDKQKPV